MSKKRQNSKLGIILVAFGQESLFEELLYALTLQKKLDDEIVVIDNHPNHLCADIAEKFPQINKIIRSQNVGFAVGANIAAKALSDDVDVVFLINPDTMPDPGLLREIRSGDPKWGAWMALLTLPSGRINSAGNVLHVSGLSWCGQYNSTASNINNSEEPKLLSGACMAVRKNIWDQLGGFEPEYYMYYEDTSLSLSVKSIGYELGLIDKAIVTHHYDYKKSRLKWFYIERNRYIIIMEHWPTSVLLLYLPYLILVDIGLWLISIIERRFILKLKSTMSFLIALPKALNLRQKAQARRKIKPSQFLEGLSPEIDTLLLGGFSRSRIINLPSVLYYKLVLNVLKFFKS